MFNFLVRLRLYFTGFFFFVELGVMRKNRRNTYVINHPLSADISSKASLSDSLAQSNTTNYDMSTAGISSSVSDRPTHGSSLKSVNSLDDNHRSHNMPHQLQHSQYSIDLPSTTESSTTDLVTST